MVFEWDLAKAEANLRKHGIDFEDAIRVFDKPVLARATERQGEVRWLLLGEVGETVIALVFTFRGEVRRIISARKASRHEREAYYEARER